MYNFNSEAINISNINTLRQQILASRPEEALPDFEKERLLYAIDFDKALREMLQSIPDPLGQLKDAAYRLLIGGSSPWQYMNALIHKTLISENTDTDTYAITSPEHIEMIRRFRIFIRNAFLDKYKPDLKDFFSSNLGDVFNLRGKVNDNSLVEQVEVFFNFQVFIDKTGEVVYSQDIPTHEADFKKFLFEHKIICYTQKIDLLIVMAREYTSRINAAKNSGAYNAELQKAQEGTEEYVAFKKLAFVLKSLYKPFQAGKHFDYGTAKYFNDFFGEEENNDLVQALSERMCEHYKESFQSKDKAVAHVSEIKKIAKEDVSKATVEEKLQYAEKREKELKQSFSQAKREALTLKVHLSNVQNAYGYKDEESRVFSQQIMDQNIALQQSQIVIQNHQQHINAQAMQLSGAMTNANNMSQQLNEAQQQVNRLSKARQQDGANNQKAHATIASLESALNSSKEKNGQLQAELKLSEEKNGSLETQHKLDKEKIDLLETELKSSQAKNSLIEPNLQLEQLKTASVEADLKEEKSKNNSLEQRLKKETDDLKKEQDKNDRNYEAMQKYVKSDASLQAKLKNSQDELNRGRGNLKKQQEKIVILETDLMGAQNKLLALGEELEEMHERAIQVHTLENKIKELAHALKEATKVKEEPVIETVTSPTPASVQEVVEKPVETEKNNSNNNNNNSEKKKNKKNKSTPVVLENIPIPLPVPVPMSKEQYYIRWYELFMKEACDSGKRNLNEFYIKLANESGRRGDEALHWFFASIEQASSVLSTFPPLEIEVDNNIFTSISPLLDSIFLSSVIQSHADKENQVALIRNQIVLATADLMMNNRFLFDENIINSNTNEATRILVSMMKFYKKIPVVVANKDHMEVVGVIMKVLGYLEPIQADKNSLHEKLSDIILSYLSPVATSRVILTFSMHADEASKNLLLCEIGEVEAIKAHELIIRAIFAFIGSREANAKFTFDEVVKFVMEIEWDPFIKLQIHDPKFPNDYFSCFHLFSEKLKEFLTSQHVEFNVEHRMLDGLKVTKYLTLLESIESVLYVDKAGNVKEAVSAFLRSVNALSRWYVDVYNANERNVRVAASDLILPQPYTPGVFQYSEIIVKTAQKRFAHEKNNIFNLETAALFHDAILKFIYNGNDKFNEVWCNEFHKYVKNKDMLKKAFSAVMPYFPRKDPEEKICSYFAAIIYLRKRHHSRRKIDPNNIVYTGLTSILALDFLSALSGAKTNESKEKLINAKLVEAVRSFREENLFQFPADAIATDAQVGNIFCKFIHYYIKLMGESYPYSDTLTILIVALEKAVERAEQRNTTQTSTSSLPAQMVYKLLTAIDSESDEKNKEASESDEAKSKFLFSKVTEANKELAINIYVNLIKDGQKSAINFMIDNATVPMSATMYHAIVQRCCEPLQLFLRSDFVKHIDPALVSEYFDKLSSMHSNLSGLSQFVKNTDIILDTYRDVYDEDPDIQLQKIASLTNRTNASVFINEHEHQLEELVLALKLFGHPVSEIFHPSIVLKMAPDGFERSKLVNLSGKSHDFMALWVELFDVKGGGRTLNQVGDLFMKLTIEFKLSPEYVMLYHFTSIHILATRPCHGLPLTETPLESDLYKKISPLLDYGFISSLTSHIQNESKLKEMIAPQLEKAKNFLIESNSFGFDKEMLKKNPEKVKEILHDMMKYYMSSTVMDKKLVFKKVAQAIQRQISNNGILPYYVPQIPSQANVNLFAGFVGARIEYDGNGKDSKPVTFTRTLTNFSKSYDTLDKTALAPSFKKDN